MLLTTKKTSTRYWRRCIAGPRCNWPINSAGPAKCFHMATATIRHNRDEYDQCSDNPKSVHPPRFSISNHVRHSHCIVSRSRRENHASGVYELLFLKNGGKRGNKSRRLTYEQRRNKTLPNGRRTNTSYESRFNAAVRDTNFAPGCPYRRAPAHSQQQPKESLKNNPNNGMFSVHCSMDS